MHRERLESGTGETREQRAPREPLTRDRIVAAALSIVDREGAGALSMRGIAADLGVEAMSLYRHFPNKDAILDGILGAVFSEVKLSEPADTWVGNMKNGAMAAKEAFARHPNVVLFQAGRPFAPASILAWVETPLGLLKQAGFADDEAVAVYRGIVSYIFGWAFLTIGRRGTSEEAARAYVDLPESYPMLRSLGPELEDWSAGFEEGLDILLAGYDARLRGR